jgi:hypothetical protein
MLGMGLEHSPDIGKVDVLVVLPRNADQDPFHRSSLRCRSVADPGGAVPGMIARAAGTRSYVDA